MIKAKAQRNAVVKSSPSPSHSNVLDVFPKSSQYSRIDEYIISQVSPAVGNEDHCLAFFFHNYVINGDRYHPSVSVAGNEPLSASIRALSTAGLSKYHSDIRLSHSARHRYVQALSLTNTALEDTSSAVRDETLLAIVVLTSYETLTGGSERSLEAWMQHINGATTLLRLRGIEGIKHTDGRVLTMHVIGHINVACLLNNLPTPPFIYDLQEKIFEHLYDPESPAMRYQHVNLEFADFNHAVHNNLFSTPEETIARAIELEAKMVAALVDMPKYWKVGIVPPAMIPDQHAIKGGVPDFELRYRDQGVSYLWNSFHSSRILLRQTVLQNIQTIKSRNSDISKYTKLENHSRDVMRECQRNILASIPPYMRLHSHAGLLLPDRRPQETADADGLRTSLRQSREASSADRELMPEAFVSGLPAMHVLGGYGFLWPLFVAGYCSTTTPEILNCVKDMYEVLGKEMKIEQALVLRDMLCSILPSS